MDQEISAPLALAIRRDEGDCLYAWVRTEPDGLSMPIRRWWIGPMPLALAPRCLATEVEKDGRFHLDVPIHLPLIGLLVHYRGWLEPA